MELGNCATVLKYLMVFFNFLFFVLGMVVLGFGIFARVKQNDYNSALAIINAGSSQWESFSALCIAVGVFIALLGGSGCIGAAREHRGCLIVFTTLVILSFILEVSAAGVGYHYRGKLIDKVNNNLNKTLAEYVRDQRSRQITSIVKSWNSVQRTFKCCGIYGSSDYGNRGDIPDSCFRYSGREGVYEIGCKQKVYSIFTRHWKVWAGGVVGIAVVQLLAIVFAMLLMHEIRKSELSECDSTGYRPVQKVINVH